MKHPKKELFAVISGSQFAYLDTDSQVTISQDVAERTAEKCASGDGYRRFDAHIYRLTPVKSYTTRVEVQDHQEES